MTDDRLLIRVPEAARLLSVSKSKAYEMVADGSIPSVRLGGSVRVPLDALKALVDSLSKNAK